MRPLVPLLALLVLPLVPACQSNDGSGPSSALDLQPGIGGGARVFAGPKDGVGAAAELNLGKYGLRTGKAAEPAPQVVTPASAPSPATDGCPGGQCIVPPSDVASPPEAAGAAASSSGGVPWPLVAGGGAALALAVVLARRRPSASTPAVQP